MDHSVSPGCTTIDAGGAAGAPACPVDADVITMPATRNVRSTNTTTRPRRVNRTGRATRGRPSYGPDATRGTRPSSGPTAPARSTEPNGGRSTSGAEATVARWAIVGVWSSTVGAGSSGSGGT